MRIIVVVNNKGGVGKTTSAQNIGGALAKFAKGKVLLVDLDAQANLTTVFGIQEVDDTKNSGAFILGEKNFEEIVIKYNENIDIIPSSQGILSHESIIVNSPFFPLNLKNALAPKANEYDFVVIDCPPALSVLTRIALVACDYYVIPIQAEYLSYEGLRKLLIYTDKLATLNSSMFLCGVFTTRYNPAIKKRLSKEIIESTKEQLGGKFLKSFIRENIVLSQAQLEGKHIFDFNSSCKGAIDYHNLTNEILETIANYERKTKAIN